MCFTIFVWLFVTWCLAAILAYYSAGSLTCLLGRTKHLNKNQKKIFRKHCRKWFLDGLLFRFKTSDQMKQEAILCIEEIENNE